ncbi:hypothetical protein EMCRGX_G023263 [Ephydatia muelleri]
MAVRAERLASVDQDVESDADDENPGPSTSKKQKMSAKSVGATKYRTKFQKEWLKVYPFVQEVKDNPHKFLCNICMRQVACDHQGKHDIERHMEKAMHQANVKQMKGQTTLGFQVESSPINEQVIRAEVKVAHMLAQHNVPLSLADELTPLFHDIFPDSDIAKNFSSRRTKTACILNGAIAPVLQQNLVNTMKTCPFTLAIDGSTDTGVEKMNPLTVRIFNAEYAMNYALKNLPINDPMLINATFVNYDTKDDATFSQVEYFVQRFGELLPFTPARELELLQEEFTDYQLLMHDAIPSDVWNKAVTDEDEHTTYHRMDIVWHHLSSLKAPDGNPRFNRLSKIAKVVLVIPHSNAQEERIFSMINTTGSPVRILAQRILAHFRDEVEEQLQQMLQKGIIVESSSPWLASAVYLRKNSGEIRICVDYRELNKLTIKDAYPLPLMEEVQDRLAGAAIFSKLDLQSGYWQLPVEVKDREKTAFSLGPGMGSFERLPLVTTYIDDVLIHSASEEEHKPHLSSIFSRLKTAGLTLRGSKCQIGIPQVTYLRHVFCAAGVTPDETKVKTVMEWPTSSSATEQDGYVIGYVSQVLSKSEANYSVIQRECLALVYGMKQFQHYLLGHPFQLWTDHEPLQWLSGQKMEGLLCRWALALQEYDFRIVYRKVSLNTNADALSWRKGPELTATTRIDAGLSTVQIHEVQRNALLIAHDSSMAGHQGVEKTLDHLRHSGYGVSMLQDVEQYCQQCMTCQKNKPTAPMRAPLVNVPTGRPWQMVAVDILEVPVSPNNNRYLLVIQDYFTKWAEARPLPDQTSAQITHELMEVFANYGFSDIVHSDQGRNFESTVFHQTLEAFGVHKSRTTAYHPQGDGLVERFNRTLLQLLRTYVEKKKWEKYLPLALFAYRTTIHHSPGVSPFEMMYGRKPCKDALPSLTGYEYFVEVEITKAAESQRVEYNKHMAKREFHQGDLVWLSIPTADKLDARWEGNRTVTSPKSPVTVEITDGARTRRVFHVNRLRYRVQPEASPMMNTSHKQDWRPPQTDHLLVEGTPPVLSEHAPPEDPGVEVPEEPNTMPRRLAEPDLPALEQVGPAEGFAARYPTKSNTEAIELGTGDECSIGCTTL